MPTPISNLTQVLLNYFDPTDVRVRTYPYTVDAQLLNIAANALEDLDLRYGREVKARFLQTTPISLDNDGIYFGGRLPNTFIPPPDGSNPPLNSVMGLRNGQWLILQPFDDRLPTPTRINIDTTRSAVPFSSQFLFDWNSDGSIMHSVDLGNGFALPIPSSLTFWMEGAQVPGQVTILVTGIPYPTSAWQKNRVSVSETITYTTSEGAQTTRNAWTSISSVVIRGTPEGVRIACAHMPFCLPALPDRQRSYTSPRFRDVVFDRYWACKGPWLNEYFHGGPGFELSTINSYAAPEPLNDISIDPHAYTMLACSNTRLYAIDRRAVMPGRLDVTAITADPIYSVSVIYDESHQNDPVARYARIIPLAHASNTSVSSFRYIVEAPDGTAFCLDAAGTFLTYSGGAGWSGGSPTEVSIPLTQIGTYVVTLQCLDMSGTLWGDSFPYPNLGLNVLSSLDLTSVVPEARGIARDSLERLWIWTGSYAVPVELHFDAYVFDSSTNSVYVTDQFDRLSVS